MSGFAENSKGQLMLITRDSHWNPKPKGMRGRQEQEKGEMPNKVYSKHGTYVLSLTDLIRNICTAWWTRSLTTRHSHWMWASGRDKKYGGRQNMLSRGWSKEIQHMLTSDNRKHWQDKQKQNSLKTKHSPTCNAIRQYSF